MGIFGYIYMQYFPWTERGRSTPGGHTFPWPRLYVSRSIGHVRVEETYFVNTHRTSISYIRNISSQEKTVTWKIYRY